MQTRLDSRNLLAIRFGRVLEAWTYYHLESYHRKLAFVGIFFFFLFLFSLSSLQF